MKEVFRKICDIVSQLSTKNASYLENLSQDLNNVQLDEDEFSHEENNEQNNLDQSQTTVITAGEISHQQIIQEVKHDEKISQIQSEKARIESKLKKMSDSFVSIQGKEEAMRNQSSTTMLKKNPSNNLHLKRQIYKAQQLSLQKKKRRKEKMMEEAKKSQNSVEKIKQQSMKRRKEQKIKKIRIKQEQRKTKEKQRLMISQKNQQFIAIKVSNKQNIQEGENKQNDKAQKKSLFSVQINKSSEKCKNIWLRTIEQESRIKIMNERKKSDVKRQLIEKRQQYAKQIKQNFFPKIKKRSLTEGSEERKEKQFSLAKISRRENIDSLSKVPEERLNHERQLRKKTRERLKKMDSLHKILLKDKQTDQEDKKKMKPPNYLSTHQNRDRERKKNSRIVRDITDDGKLSQEKKIKKISVHENNLSKKIKTKQSNKTIKKQENEDVVNLYIDSIQAKLALLKRI